ncbi:MAG: DUF6544 family protein [Pseudomonadota bacterium]
MKLWILIPLVCLLVPTAALVGTRYLDHRADARAWDQLRTVGAGETGHYRPSLVLSLPEPAQRYFNFMIEPGTPLFTSVELAMSGKLGLGSRETPRYDAMTARQILSPPHGLLWRLSYGLVSGSDAALETESWTRFWLAGLIPVVRVSNPDHHRAAFGRVVIEAAVWVPASLLPSETVRWEPLNDSSARAIVSFGRFVQAVDITVDDEGAPRRVVIQRWSDGNSQKEFRLQPFGGELSEFRRFEGYRLPTRIAVGNHFGTAEYFPFLRADISEIRFPQAEG